MTAASRERFAAVVRAAPVDLALACALVGVEVEPDLDVAEPLGVLDALAEAARPHLPPGASPAQAAAGLARALGREAGLAGSSADYDALDASLLQQVLRRGHGLPLLLSIVWSEVAGRLGVPAGAVALPGHVVAVLGTGDDAVFVDAFRGGPVVAASALRAQAVAATGEAPDLRAADPVDLLLRLLTNVRALSARQGRAMEAARTRLWATELSLLLPRHPLGLRRERGELMVRLGDHLGGARALEDYADLAEDADDASAQAARQEARQARARLN